MKSIRTCVTVAVLLVCHSGISMDYFIHPTLGNDANDGTSKKTALRSLARASMLPLHAGDRILLASGQIYPGSLALRKLSGIDVTSVAWDSNEGPVHAIIDAKGAPEGILIEDCSDIRITLIAITGNGYYQQDTAYDLRSGVMLRTRNAKSMKNIVLDGLRIYDVFFENPGHMRAKGEVATANGTERYGWGIRLMNPMNDALMENVLIQNCEIENIDHTAIKLTGKERNIQQVRIVNNTIRRSGGPGIQMSNVRYIYVAGNEVNYSGSADDSRKWGRGSGLWTWSASNILIERNRFLNANGPGDSAGAHIDYNCDNVIMQYNFSANNAGGFCEILGNNYNCAYRYNISVDDGHRIKGQNGAFQEGKTFWLSGYQGNKERKGPVNTYFYNNTIYVSARITSKVAIDNSSRGVVIVNNIFYIEGKALTVAGDQYRPDESRGGTIDRLVFKHNLYLNKDSWPDDALIQDRAPLFGDPGFKSRGGLAPQDYIPTNKALGSGVEVPFVPGDDFGLISGLRMTEDFLGNKITGPPGLGAIGY